MIERLGSPWTATSLVQSYSRAIGSTRLDPGKWEQYTGPVLSELSASPVTLGGLRQFTAPAQVLTNRLHLWPRRLLLGTPPRRACRMPRLDPGATRSCPRPR